MASRCPCFRLSREGLCLLQVHHVADGLAFVPLCLKSSLCTWRGQGLSPPSRPCSSPTGSKVLAPRWIRLARGQVGRPSGSGEARDCERATPESNFVHIFHIRIFHMNHHTLLVGTTGSGKSTWLRSHLLQVMNRGHGCLLLDPHGDLVDAVLALVPRFRLSDVRLFDPTKPNCPGLNPFRSVPEAVRPLAVVNLLSAMRKLFGADAFGPRTDHLLRHTFLALCEVRGATLQDALALLVDERRRTALLKQVRDPQVLRFWFQEFPSYSKQLQGDAIAAPANKLGALVTLGAVRQVVLRSKPRLDVPRVLARQQLVLARLAKGEIGEDGALFLGGLLVGAFQAAIMARASLPPEARRPFEIVIDEAGSFAAAPLLQLLAEARKYGVALTLATQSVAVLEPRVRAAILGNVGSLQVFRVGGEDAELLGPELAHEYGVRTLTSLGVGERVVRVLGGRPEFCPTPPSTPSPEPP